MSFERVPPRSAYEFSPPLRAWPATSRSLRPRHFPTTAVEVRSLPRRLVTVLAISILSFFFFVTFFLFVFFLTALIFIGSFIQYLYSLDRYNLNQWSNTWQAASVVLQAEGIGSGSRDEKMRLWKIWNETRDFQDKDQYGCGWKNWERSGNGIIKNLSHKGAIWSEGDFSKDREGKWNIGFFWMPNVLQDGGWIASMCCWNSGVKLNLRQPCSLGWPIGDRLFPTSEYCI